MYHTSTIQTLLPTAALETVSTPIGELKILTFTCEVGIAEAIINEATKLGYPHQRFTGGVKIFA